MPIFSFLLPTSSRHKEGIQRVDVEASIFIANLKKLAFKVGPKDGHALVGATLVDGGRLERKYVDKATALILDIDGGADPDDLLPKLPYRYIAHTSYNHSPEKPKYRVILPLTEPITPEQHHRLWWFFFEKLDHALDPACKDPGRLFFLPRIASEDRRELHWFREGTGPYLSYTVVPADWSPPNDVVFDGPRRSQGVHRAVAGSQYRQDDPEALVAALMALPAFQWAVENPSDVSREVWRGLATNLAAAVAEYGGGAIPIALEAFHDLSAADAARYNHHQTGVMFRGALDSVAQHGPVSYAHMHTNGLPTDAGEGENKNPVVQARRNLRSQSDTRQPWEAPVVTAEPAAPPDVQEVTPTAVSATPPPPPPSSPTRPPPGPSDPAMPMADDYLYDMAMKSFYIRTASRKWAGPIGSEAFKQHLLSRGLPSKVHEAFRMDIPTCTKREAVFTSIEEIVEVDGLLQYNPYHLPDIQPVQGNWDDVRACIMNLVDQDAAGYEYVLDWLAGPLQSLYRVENGRLCTHKGHYKNDTTLVFHGAQGSGKGTLETIMRLFYGEDFTVTIGQSSLDGIFNGEIADALFVIANEVISTTNRGEESANKTKPWISDRFITIEDKYVKRRLVRNALNIIYTSNSDRPVTLDKDDRRHSVFKSTKRLPMVLTRRLYADLKGPQNQAKAFLYHLLAERVIKIPHAALYYNDARTALIKAASTSDDTFVDAVLTDGWFSVASGWVDAAKQGEIREPAVSVKGEFIVISSTMNDVYRYWCHNHGVKPRSHKALGGSINSEIPGAEGVRVSHGGVQKRAWAGIPMKVGDDDVLPTQSELPALPAGKTTDDADFT